MYNKLFTQILDSSIWLAPDPHRLVWITLIAAMDQNGMARFACAANLAARARVSLEDTEAAIVAFESPDPYEPSQEYEGRRIERVPGGWFVLNAEKYRGMVTRAVATEQSRVRMQKHREKLRNVTQPLQDVTPSVSVSVSVSKAESESKIGAPRRAVKVDPEGFAAIQKAYPRRGGGQRWDDAKKGYARSLAAGTSPGDILGGVERYAHHIRADGKEGTPYVQQAATFLGANESWREAWEPVKRQKELSAVERVAAAGAQQHESVVATQSSQGFEDLDLLGSDVRNPVRSGLRRIGS